MQSLRSTLIFFLISLPLLSAAGTFFLWSQERGKDHEQQLASFEQTAKNLDLAFQFKLNQIEAIGEFAAALAKRQTNTLTADFAALIAPVSESTVIALGIVTATAPSASGNPKSAESKPKKGKWDFKISNIAQSAKESFSEAGIVKSSAMQTVLKNSLVPESGRIFYLSDHTKNKNYFLLTIPITWSNGIHKMLIVSLPTSELVGKTMLKRVFGASPDILSEVYIGKTINRDSLIFSESNPPLAISKGVGRRDFTTINGYKIGRTYLTLYSEADEKFLEASQSQTPTIILVTGSLVSLAFLFFPISLLHAGRRARKMADRFILSARENEGHFKTLSARAPIGIIHFNRFGKCTFVNAEWERLTNTHANNSYGDGWKLCLDKNQQDQLQADWSRLQSENIEIVHDLLIQNAQTKETWIRTKTSRLVDINGVLVGFVSTWLDITIQKRAERAFQDENKQLSKIILNAPVAIAMIDRHLKYAAHSGEWHQFFPSGNHARFTGLKFHDVCPPEFSKFSDLIRNALKDGQTCSSTEDKITGENGREIYLRWTITPILSHEGAVSNVIIVMQQITQLVEARQVAIETGRFKSEFLANMSHEIRTPMNGVIGMTDILLQTQLSREQREYAEIIQNSGNSLLTIINDILDYSKIEAGKIEMENIEIDLQQVVEETTQMLAEKSYEKGVALLVDFDPKINRYVYGDPVRIRQILTNLTGNAIKFTEKGEVVVSIRVKDADTRSCNVIFSVEDTGIGIPKEAQKKLFQSFSQADGSTTRRFGGTGLGLVISKRLVQIMGGDLQLESSPGVGTKFFFKINMRFTDIKSELSSLDISYLSGRTARLADPNDRSRSITENQLKALGLKVAAQPTPFSTSQVQTHNEELVFCRLDQASSDSLAAVLAAASLYPDKTYICLTTLSTKYLVSRELENLPNAFAVACPMRSVRLVGEINNLRNPSSTTVETKDHEGSEVPAETKWYGKLLVVDDNPINRKFAEAALAGLGFDIDFAVNGLEAVNKASQKLYSLILMDCHMPELDGYEATRQIRAGGQLSADFPIVAMTASVLQADLDRCIASGMNDYVTKPLKLATFRSIVKKWGEKALDYFEEKGMSPPPADSIFSDSPEIHTPDESPFRFNLIQNEKPDYTQGLDKDHPVIDHEIWNEMTSPEFKNGVQVLNEMLDSLRQSLPETISRLQTLLDQGNLEQIIEVAHQTAGSCGCVGASRLHYLFKNLEESLREGLEVNIGGIISQIESEKSVFFSDVHIRLQKSA